MANEVNRITEIIDKNINNKTAILESNYNPIKIRETDIMLSDHDKTEILGTSRPTFSTSFSIGMQLCGLKIIGIISESTGEASLLLGEKDEQQYVLKMYHQNKKPKDVLLNILKEINSPYLVKPVESSVYEGRFYEILPYYINGDLSAIQTALDAKIIEQIVVPCINEGLHCLHEHGVVHRDIKPSNIFFNTEKNTVIIGDFGISSVLNSDVSVRATTMSRTFGYAAPETSSGFISKESDYYSFGVTLLHLITGQDPFIGMTDMQILFQTINKKLEIPQTVNKRLATLIRGLTIKDRADRWGYEEVNRWLNNETVAVVEKTKKIPGVKAYQFNKTLYYSLEDIGKAFALDWENAKKHLYRGFVERNVLQYGEETASRCIDLKELKDKDVAVFRLIYVLNPDAPLGYKGRIFNDIEHIGIEMAHACPEKDEHILEMITNGCLEYYLNMDNAYDKAFISRITDIATKIKAGHEEYYFALMHFLYPQRGFILDNVSFITIEDFANYLESLNDDLLYSISKRVVDDYMFHMWVYSLGFTQQIEEWLAIYEKAVW